MNIGSKIIVTSLTIFGGITSFYFLYPRWFKRDGVPKLKDIRDHVPGYHNRDNRDCDNYDNRDNRNCHSSSRDRKESSEELKYITEQFNEIAISFKTLSETFTDVISKVSDMEKDISHVLYLEERSARDRKLTLKSPREMQESQRPLKIQSPRDIPQNIPQGSHGPQASQEIKENKLSSILNELQSMDQQEAQRLSSECLKILIPLLGNTFNTQEPGEPKNSEGSKCLKEEIDNLQNNFSNKDKEISEHLKKLYKDPQFQE